jgi:hypothetical protein
MATFLYNFTLDSFSLLITKTSGSTRGLIFYTHIVDTHIYKSHFFDDNWRTRTNLSIPFHSDDQFTLKIDLNNVSMEDNGTYQISSRDYACYILYVMGEYYLSGLNEQKGC